jgi:hypothetical protein
MSFLSSPSVGYSLSEYVLCALQELSELVWLVCSKGGGRCPFIDQGQWLHAVYNEGWSS